MAVLPHVSAFSDASGLLNARLDAIARVETPHFFFLDDDDELPANFEEVLRECLRADAPLVYTNELVRENGAEFVRKSLPYSQRLHLADPCLVHHLALCHTATAREMAVPRGCYGFEPLFYWQLAKRGAAWVDRVGYIWNRSTTGLSKHHSVVRGMVESASWAHRNR